MEPDPELDALLQRQRPRPDAAWIRATEDRLMPRRRSWAPLRVGGFATAGLAALLLAVTLADGNSNDAVQAKDRCRTVTVTRVERLPRLVVNGGQPEIVYTRKPVARTVRRCG